MELSDYCIGVVEKVQKPMLPILESVLPRNSSSLQPTLSSTPEMPHGILPRITGTWALRCSQVLHDGYHAQTTSALLHSQELGLRVNTMCMVLPAIASLIGAGLHGMKEYDQGGDRFLRNLAAALRLLSFL